MKRTNKRLILAIAVITGILAYIQFSYATAAPCSAFSNINGLDHAQAALYVNCHN